jgi:hypothetical protein
MSLGYVSRAEITGTHLFESRHEILDLNDTIVRTVLSDRFGREFQAAVFESNSIKQWNRRNPHSIIDNNSKISQKAAIAFLKEHLHDLRVLQASILKPVIAEIDSEAGVTPEDQKMRQTLCRALISQVTYKVWYVALAVSGGAADRELLLATQSLLRRYLQKSAVIDYIGLMVVELAGYLQNNLLVRIAQQAKGGVDFETLIRDPVMMQQVRALVTGAESQAISWRLAARSGVFEKRVRLVIRVHSRGEEMSETRSRVNERKSADLREDSLKGFLRATSDGTIDSDLGLYYLSYLTQCCSELGILFESTVTRSPSSEKASINLTFHF